ncbi:MAG TPA: alpha/beta fold hydrolase [Candidatus Acidoferrales bacterium]|jgi:dipeptidyl aminopeptidase/acylaminoacyl peptidase|nr:alpha/beta fold hydrolase [Candidatus Acidoferrales bacterium]
MRRLRTLIPLSLLALNLAAQNKPAATQGLPPLIDRELLFGNPEIASAQLSPDGKYLAFLKPWKDTRNVWVKRVEEPFSAARLLTTESKRPIPTFLWSRDGKYVGYVKDSGGDENFNLYVVDPGAPPAAGAEAPPSRDLTGLKGVTVQLYSAPKNDPDILYIGINDRDKAWHDLYKVKISTGEKTLMRKNTDRVAAWFFDTKGQLRLAFRVADNGDQEMLRVDANALTKVYSCSVFETCDPLRFHKDGKRVYMDTNKGDTTDLSALALFDPESGKIETVESDPLKRVDLGGAIFSEVTEELAQTNYTDDRVRRYFKDKGFESEFKWLATKLAGKEVGVNSRTRDEQLWLVTANSDTEPGETYLFDRKAHTLALQYKIRENLPRASLAPMKAIRYQSSDGLEIPAYLTLPKGVPAKGLPTLVIPHGGPWARDGWGYNGMAQFFANRGYAVLSPNFRGSTGYGKKFLNAGNGEWGRKMQDDITWGVKYLIAEGTADPKRIGILGGSYGGYATLAGVTFTPDVYRAAVDIVGPSNLLTLLEAIPPYWEAGRKLMYARMADPGTPAGKAWMEERSPLNSAAKIKTPLLVVQGANDPRVNRREAEQIVIALRDRGFPVEYMLAPDEGHGFARPVNNMAMFMAAEKFLAKYLDGRYQEGGTPEVTKRLAEIMVDPKTVTVTKKVDATAVGLPKPAMDLKPGTYKYQAKIAMGPQEMAIKVSTTIKEENGAWTATDTMDTPMGAATDTVSIEKGSLVVRKRTVKQGAVNITVDFAGGKATGNMSMNGQDRPVSADLGGELFADSAGAQEVIGCLPLTDGYSVTFRNFDLQKQKAKLMQLKVVGQETVTVAAGKFETFKVEISSADGGGDQSTVWIAKDSRQAVKLSSVVASMGGAQMTAELVP